MQKNDIKGFITFMCITKYLRCAYFATFVFPQSLLFATP